MTFMLSDEPTESNLTPDTNGSASNSSAAKPHAAAKSQSTSKPVAPALPDDVARSLVELFKLLADETRLRILYLLRQKHELNVRALCQLLKQSQPAVSHHLALLRVSGLIEMRRDGKHNFYRILPKRFEERMGMMFALSPDEPQEIRFKDFVLSYTQAAS